MSRMLSPKLCTFIFCLAVASSSSATTYYVAANGADTNNGTSKTTPWLHAPGMANCSNVCASARINPGDSVIFRGGDTWYFGGAGSPAICSSTGITCWSFGSAGNSSANIYIGVDETWYTGSSWTRPILNGGNAVSTSLVSSCAYDYSSGFTVLITGGGYVQFDNFEIFGICWGTNGNNQPGWFRVATTNSTSTGPVQFSNIYAHGWGVTATGSDNNPVFTDFIAPPYPQVNIGPGVVVDGEDSPHFAAGDSHCQGIVGDACASGQAMNGTATYDVYQSVFRYVANVEVSSNCHSFHDNLFEYLYEDFPANPQHPNIANCLNAPATTTFFYNNILRHTYVHEDVMLGVSTTAYVFNNVFYDNMTCPSGCGATGFFRLMASNNASPKLTAYVYNNTFGDNTGIIAPAYNNNFSPNPIWHGTVYFQNNHFIGASNSSLNNWYDCTQVGPGGTCTITDNGNEIYQTTSVANGQGYVAANNYSPTSTSNATVGAGADLTSSCTTFSSDSALCSGTSGGAAESSGDGSIIAQSPAITLVSRPSGAAWNAGSYEYNSGSPVNPPTGLTAVVQ